MRDPARISKVIDALWLLWREHPDMRFGQLVVNILRGYTGNDLVQGWSLEEPEWLELITNAEKDWGKSKP